VRKFLFPFKDIRYSSIIQIPLSSIIFRTFQRETEKPCNFCSMVYNGREIRKNDVSFFLSCFEEVLPKRISGTVATPLEGFL